MAKIDACALGLQRIAEYGILQLNALHSFNWKTLLNHFALELLSSPSIKKTSAAASSLWHLLDQTSHQSVVRSVSVRAHTARSGLLTSKSRKQATRRNPRSCCPSPVVLFSSIQSGVVLCLLGFLSCYFVSFHSVWKIFLSLGVGF